MPSRASTSLLHRIAAIYNKKAFLDVSMPSRASTSLLHYSLVSEFADKLQKGVNALSG